MNAPLAPIPNQGTANQSQSWRSLLLLSAYRWLIAIFLTGTFYSGRAHNFFGDELQSSLFEIACLAYLLLCLLTTTLILLKRPGLNLQVYGNAVIDVSTLSILVFAAGGVPTGLGMLLIAPIAGTSMLLPRRLGVLVGAVATLVLLGVEVWRYLYLETETTNFIQAGILGLIYLFVALIANTLSARAAASEALAARRKLALDSLAQINERIIAHMQVGVLVVDAVGRIRMLNQAACELLDTRPSAAGKPLALEAPAISAALKAWQQKPVIENDPRTVETQNRTLLAHFNRLAPMPEVPALIFLEDASRISEQAQQMKLAALGRLTASIAHEIRNPLGAISHASQLLAENQAAQAQDQRLLNIIHRHTARINVIVEEMLGLSRREQTMPKSLRLRPWLEQVAREYCEARPKDTPRIDLEMVSPAVEIHADPGQLIQVLHNLWDNSLSHSGLPTDQLVIQLSADAWPESNRVHLDVYDNGHGISPQLAADIFEPFYTTTRGGTGLGLYIARELCECNHAKLSLIHGSTLGACFRIIFANPAEWLEQDVVTSHSAEEYS